MKTEHLGFAPRYSEDGTDYLYTELDLAVTGVINPFAMSTRGPGQFNGAAVVPPFLEDAPNAAPPGDTVGNTLRNLRAMLLTPRLPLTFSINNDQVVNITGPDSKNGPLPQPDTSVRWIIGTRTALVYFHVKAWSPDLLPLIPGQPTPERRIVLANRYRVASSTDDDYYSRRVISGQMVIDINQLQTVAADGVLTPDNFRAAAFLQIPSGFKRENIQATVSSDNTTLDYSYVDQELPLALGLRSLATRIEGSATVGASSPALQAGGATAAALGAFSGAAAKASPALGSLIGSALWGAIPGGGFLRAGFIGAAGPLAAATDPGGVGAGFGGIPLGTGLPKIVGTAVVRVWGQRAANKADLAMLGLNVIIDRFFTAGGFFAAYFTQDNAPRIGQITVMQDFNERFVEVSASFIPTYFAMLSAGVDIEGTSLQLMNMNTDINVTGVPGQLAGPQANAGPILSGDITGVNPPPPNSNGTRGDWVGALVVSLLGTPGEIPVNAPADPAVNIDVPFQ